MKYCSIITLAVLLTTIQAKSQQKLSTDEERLQFMKEVNKMAGNYNGPSLKPVIEHINKSAETKFDVEKYKTIFHQSETQVFLEESKLFSDVSLSAYWPSKVKDILLDNMYPNSALLYYNFKFANAYDSKRNSIPLTANQVTEFISLQKNDLSYNGYSVPVDSSQVKNVQKVKGELVLVYPKDYTPFSFKANEIGQTKTLNNITATLLALKNDFAMVKFSTKINAGFLHLTGYNMKNQVFKEKTSYSNFKVIHSARDEKGNIIPAKEKELIKKADELYNWCEQANQFQLDNLAKQNIVVAINVMGKIDHVANRYSNTAI